MRKLLLCFDEGGSVKVGKHCSSSLKNLFYSPISPILPISSSSDVMDLERRAIAGVLSLLLCCGTECGEKE